MPDRASPHGPASIHRLAQYLGAAAPPLALQDDLPPPLALQDDLPLLAGAAPPPALQELLPPLAAGALGSGVAAAPPPQATIEPIIIPATADTARAFAMFMTCRLLAPPRGAFFVGFRRYPTPGR
jgi:hypothetical protein